MESTINQQLKKILRREVYEEVNTGFLTTRLEFNRSLLSHQFIHTHLKKNMHLKYNILIKSKNRLSETIYERHPPVLISDALEVRVGVNKYTCFDRS